MDPDRLARALVDELVHTASDGLLERVHRVSEPRTRSALRRLSSKRYPTPEELPAYLLARDPEWIQLVERATEVAEG